MPRRRSKFRERMGLILEPLGFSAHDDGFLRPSGDVHWTCGANPWGNRDGSGVKLTVSVGVLSEPLYKATLDWRSSYGWLDSQVSVDIQRLAEQAG